jgi:hypothetical protein
MLIKDTKLKKGFWPWGVQPFKIFVLSLILLTSFPTLAQGYSSLYSAQSLLLKLDSQKFSPLFEQTDVRFSSFANAPLANFQPRNNAVPYVTIGADLHRYKRDFLMISSVIPRSIRPDFETYMIALTALSLANETAHFYQYQNGSLNDFQTLRRQGLIAQSCALYSLQQHVSDILMLNTAYLLEQRSNEIERQALRAALEKMDLLELYRDFYRFYEEKPSLEKNEVLQRLKQERDNENMKGLSFCKGTGSAHISRPLIMRAQQPIQEFLNQWRGLGLQNQTNTNSYNR